MELAHACQCEPRALNDKDAIRKSKSEAPRFRHAVRLQQNSSFECRRERKIGAENGEGLAHGEDLRRVSELIYAGRDNSLNVMSFGIVELAGRL
jgi:hypothetical protein